MAFPRRFKQSRQAGSDAHTLLPQSRVWAFFIGTFGFEFASKALQVTLPLLLLKLSGSLSTVGFISSLNAALDTTGTLVGGWVCHRLHPRTLLITSTALRAVFLGAIPALWASDALTLESATAIYLADSLVRGVADTARNTMPLMFAGKDKNTLSRLNSRYQTFFELGSIAGSVLAGGLLISFGELSANWSVSVAFAVAAAVYLFMPKTSETAAPKRLADGSSNFITSTNVMIRSPALRLSLIGIISLTLYPLKALLPAFFADSILRAPEQAAWLNALFGVGALAGALIYGRYCGNHSASIWLRLSTVGVLALAGGWLPGSFLPMALAIFSFSLANVMARLAMTSTMQSQIPHGAEGAVMGATRFSVNLTSMGVRFLVGVAFAIAASPTQGFAFLSAGLAIFALLQIIVAHRLENSRVKKSFQEVDIGRGLAPTDEDSGSKQGTAIEGVGI